MLLHINTLGGREGDQKSKTWHRRASKKKARPGPAGIASGWLSSSANAGKGQQNGKCMSTLEEGVNIQAPEGEQSQERKTTGRGRVLLWKKDPASGLDDTLQQRRMDAKAGGGEQIYKGTRRPGFGRSPQRNKKTGPLERS